MLTSRERQRHCQLGAQQAVQLGAQRGQQRVAARQGRSSVRLPVGLQGKVRRGKR